MRYKGTHKPLPEIARELNVDAVVEGSVGRSENRVRVSAELVDATNQRNLWAQNYDRDLRDVLQLQNEIAKTVAIEVSGKLNSAEETRLRSRPQRVNSQAYETYLKGQYFLDKWTAEGFEKARGYFQQTIALDPNYAQGYGGLAEYYALVAFTGTVPPRDAWLTAENLVTKSLAMDDSSSRAHTLLGMLKLQFRCDREGAEKELNRALELNPGDMNALDLHSYYLLEIGRTDEATAEKRRVLEHDPLRVITNAELGLYLLMAGRNDEAIVQLQKAVELDPNYAAAHMRLGMAYENKLQYEQAVIKYQKAISLDRSPSRFARLGELYARWGKRNHALETIRELREMSKQQYVSPTAIAQIYARLGQSRTAIAWLQKAKTDDNPKITEPGFDSLRSDPQYKALEARLAPDPNCPAF